MPSLKLSIWGDKLSLEEALHKLLMVSGEIPVVKELAKGLLFERSFEKYNVPAIEEEKTKGELLDHFLKASNLSDPAKFKLFLEKTKQDREGIIASLLYRERIERLKNKVISSEQIKEVFALNKARLQKVSFAAIRVDSEGLAKEIYHRIKDDKEEFGQLAKEFSLGPEASSAGLLPPQELSKVRPEIKNHLLLLKPGEISEPFKVGSSVLIIKLIELESPSLTPQLAKSISDDLFQRWIDAELLAAEAQLIEVE